MRIYEIGTGYTPIPAQMGAATEIVVEQLARALLKDGYDVEIIDICANDRKKSDLPIKEVRVPKRFTASDVTLGIMHKLKRVAYSVSLAMYLKKILTTSDEKIVLHFHNQYNLYFALKLIPRSLFKKATVAYTVHSYIWGDEWLKIKSKVKRKYFQEVLCVKNADIVFVLNDITTEHFVSKLGVDRNKIHKIVNGVNTECYAPLGDTDIAKLKLEHGLEGKTIILQVGSVCERKNQLGAIDMLTEYLKCHEDAMYMYVGGLLDEEYKHAIDALALERGISDRIVYAGECAPGKQLNAYYNIADCCVFTSELESFGLVIIESIAAGTPVVLGDNLMFDLDSGFCMYHSREEFVAMVEKNVTRNKLSSSEVNDILDKYSWSAVAREYVTLFENN